MKKLVLLLVVCLLAPSWLIAQELQSIPADEAREWGARLAAAAGKLEKLQVRIEADADKANGIHVPDKLGLMVVPQQDLRETEELAEKFKAESGAPLAFLFGYRVVPVVEGKRVDASRLRTVKLTGDDGDEHTVNLLLLAVRQLSDEDYRLYVYGTDEKPLVDARFSEGTGPGAEPVAVEIKDPDANTHEGNVVVTVFGKYQASFRAGHQE